MTRTKVSNASLTTMINITIIDKIWNSNYTLLPHLQIQISQIKN